MGKPVDQFLETFCCVRGQGCVVCKQQLSDENCTDLLLKKIGSASFHNDMNRTVSYVSAS